MSTIAIDPAEMEDAAKHVGAMFDESVATVDSLHGLGAGVEMPANMAARVQDVTARVAMSVARSGSRISPLAQEFLRRAGDAQRADQVGKLTGGLVKAGDMFQKQLDLGIDHPVTPIPAGAVKYVEGAGKALGAAGKALNLAPQTAKDLSNPYLTDDQRATRLAKKAVISEGLALPAAMVGASVGGPVGFVAGLAVGTAIGVADSKLHLGDKISDGIDAAADAAADLAKGAAGLAEGAFEAVF